MAFPTHYRICFLLFSLKAILSCLDGQCRELEFPGSYFFYGERLINHVIRTVKVLDQDSCELQCYLEHNCASINFELTGTHNCDLNNATHKEHEKDLLKTEGYVYHGTNNACGKTPCKNNATCQTGFTSKGYRCLCSTGFRGDNCELDIDECKENIQSCDADALCNNTIGSYICTCKAGYSGDGQDCGDIDECALDTDTCDAEAECNNIEGSYSCTCKPGYSGDGHICTDIDECALDTDTCDAEAECNNTEGSYSCTCKPGYSGDGHICTDINECALDTDTCDVEAECNNTEGSYSCTCKPRYSGDRHICTAIDFCAIQNPCKNGGECESKSDGYFCRCEVGFTGKTCETNLPVNSTILSKNASYVTHLLHFLGSAVGNDSQWKLCYRASFHGWDAFTFHSLCDGKKNTVTIIESNQYVFGGYTDAPWGSLCPQPGRCCYFPFEFEGKTYHQCTRDGSSFFRFWCSLESVYDGEWVSCGTDSTSTHHGGYRNTDKAFIYSLRNKEGLRRFKSMVKNPSQAIYMNPSYGPTFGGGHDIYIADNANDNRNSYAKVGSSYNLPSGVNYQTTILAGRFHFTPDEVEVFYLI